MQRSSSQARGVLPPAAPTPSHRSPVSHQVPRPPASPARAWARHVGLATQDPLEGRAGWILVLLLLALFARPLGQTIRLVAADLAVAAEIDSGGRP